jgi:GTP-binding protein HflX
MSREPRSTAPRRERVLTCGVLLPGQAREAGGPLGELRALLEAAGAEPIGEGVVQRKADPDPATLMGRGKVAEVRAQVERQRPDAVAVDNDLSPAQIRNLEKAWGVRVLDRSEVILDIFARRARTRQAQLQVELAQAEYLLPRLRRMWTHLERTEGAIGTRGPGETQLETDRRLLRKRVLDLRRELDHIEERRRREVASRSEAFTVGLVGYTNAGKSTLLNRLTGAQELEADMLFATLDTRTRQWRLPDGRKVLLSDTVGFLSRLPHHLVASFHATLEETLHADVLIHVVDASSPDAGTQIEAVDAVLAELSWHTRAEILALNKVDRVEEPLALQLLARDAAVEVVHVSARTGDGLERLTEAVARRLDQRSWLVDVIVPLADGRTAAAVRRAGALLEEQTLGTERLRLRVRLSDGALGSLQRGAGSEVRFEVVAPPLVPLVEPEGLAPRPWPPG